MASEARYEMLEKIGSGSFAAVYRALDKELGREVAVKQIHDQFLSEPGLLDRYWLEAQMLASLNHPNIITFFDVDRDRGWLIMELMQGNLSERMGGRQMNLKSLKAALAQCLRALSYLHERGIVHGDVKPSNMMIDDRKRIKIGDFGLARRTTDDDGSMLRGTTKYMAPEVVSDEFGEVTAASDLYSLGFSSYELMCGENFENLFPGLNASGRDKQVAWMMWHAAADRRLPKIERVLDGVPEDLAQVIDKLIEKKPEERYTTADEALSDLSIDLRIIKDESGKTPVDPNAEANAKRRKIAIAAFAGSMVLSLVMLLKIFTGGNDQPQTGPAEKPIIGAVGKIMLESRILIIDLGPDLEPKEVPLGVNPKILLNRKEFIHISDLEEGDRVVMNKIKDEAGKTRWKIAATRPDEDQGYVKAMQDKLQTFTLVLEGAGDRGEIQITVTGDTKISLNGNQAELGKLQNGDRVTIHHIADPENSSNREAINIEALQQQKLQGIVRDFDVDLMRLTIEVMVNNKLEMKVLPVSKDCNVTVNGKQVMNSRKLKPANLEPGDRVEVTHNTHIFSVAATRRFSDQGSLVEVKDVDRTLVIMSADAKRMLFVVDDPCEIQINGRPAELADLRRDDQLDLGFDRTDQGNIVKSIRAKRATHANRWVIIVANENYDDVTLSKLSYPVRDAKRLRETLINRYGCSPERVLLLEDETRVRLVAAVPDWLRKTDSDSEVIVYFAGHAYLNEDSQTYLAARDFDLSRVSESGLSFAWLREQLENCPAHEKLLLLDTCHSGEGADLSLEPSTTDALASLKSDADPAVFKTTYAIASCQSGQRGLAWDEKQQGLFGFFLAEAYSGLGDKNRDVHLAPTELFEFLKTAMIKVTIDDKKQIPSLFVPNATPPAADRLTAAAKKAIGLLIANNWDRSKLSITTRPEFQSAQAQVGAEPDAMLAYSMLLLKTRDRKEALRLLQQVKIGRPDLLLTYEAIAWIQTEEDKYRDALRALTDLVNRIANNLKESEELAPDDPRLLRFCGAVREFMATVPESARRPTAADFRKLDDLIDRSGAESGKFYTQGRADVTEIVESYAEKIKNAKSDGKKKLLELDRKRLVKYVPFDFQSARQHILEGLND